MMVQKTRKTADMAASQLLKTVRIATYMLPESTKLMLQVSTHDQKHGSHLGRNVQFEQ